VVFKKHFHGRIVAAAVTAVLTGGVQASCGSAYCLVNTRWENQGVMTGAGDQFDLRYEYIHQDQLMADDSRVKPAGEIGEHDEKDTTNRNLQLTYSHVSAGRWGVSVQLPLVSRDHHHVHNESSGPEPEDWHFNEPGDVRVLGQYRLSADGESATVYGALAGIKLPTGDTDIDNKAGEEAERTLQPGTGTTDFLAGAYVSHVLSSIPGTVFAQAVAQRSVNEHDHFRPGEQLGIDAGYRYPVTPRLGLNLQLNYLTRWRDDGSNAEPDDSGLRALFASPGIGYAITPAVHVYGFVQLPVYQNVNGTQLTADKAVAAGITTRF
jgi:hypothetical protein